MTTLAAEPNLFPLDLLAGDEPGSPDCAWLAVMTKPRQEKSLARYLLEREVPFFLPLVKQEKRIGQRRLLSYLPLFAGYVFLRATDDQRVECLKSNRVVQILSPPDPNQLRRDLRQVHQLVLADAPLTIEQRLATGDKVRVKRGPLRGLEGMVLSRRGTSSRLLVAVHFLQKGASVEVDDFDLQPLGS